MQRVKRSTAVAALPSDPAGGTPGYFASPDPAGGIPATVPGFEWYNNVQEELVAAAGLDGADLGGSSRQIADVLAARLRCFNTGVALPMTDIGPIWHEDYASIMTWQAFTANGAAYTGYASVLVGGLLIDTQPTPRVGYVRSGVTNLNRTAYAALRGWAMHNGIMVAAGTWAAGNIAVKDNADGTTFTAFDIRGEFLRIWSDGGAVNAGRGFGTHEDDDLKSHSHGLKATATSPTGGGQVVLNSGAAIGDYTVATGGAETKPRSVAVLATIKI